MVLGAKGQETIRCKFDNKSFEGFYGKNESGAVIRKHLQCCTLEYQAVKDAKIQLDTSEHEYQANMTEGVIISKLDVGFIPEDIFISFPKLELLAITESKIALLRLNSLKMPTNH